MRIDREVVLAVALVSLFLFACWLDHRKVSLETDPLIRRQNYRGGRLLIRFLIFLLVSAVGFVLVVRN
jgi:hypothetical protein